MSSTLSPQEGARGPRHPAMRKSELSASRRWLVERMQQLGFGRIKHLVIANGEPVLNPPPRILRHRRFTGPNNSRREAKLENFALKRQVVNLLNELDAIGSGVITALDVRDGLPYGMSMEDPDRST